MMSGAAEGRCVVVKRKDDRNPRWTGADIAAVITSVCNGVVVLMTYFAHVHG